MNMQDSSHWADQHERGHRVFLLLTTWMVRWLPAGVMRVCTWFVVLYFYATAPNQRRYIACYQARLRAAFPQAPLPKRWPVLRQFVAFGQAIADRFAVWQRKIRYEDLVLHDPDNIYAEVSQYGQRGQIFVCSHVGNIDICRALVSHHHGFKLNVLVHSRHAEAFNRALTAAGADEIQLIQVTDLDAALMMELNRRLDEGEWIAIAADRTPVRGEKTVTVDFLGGKADMPQGAWLLAGLLKTKIHTLFCIWEQGRYQLKLRHFADASDWKRGERTAAVAAAAQAYADRLAEECAQAPLQWFNFYDFWKDDSHG